MRWPIKLQLLLPVLGVVLLAIMLASFGSAYFGAQAARRTQQENLRRVVSTLSEAIFPLTETVLRQMSGLSGAEFVLLDRRGRLQTGTLRLNERELQTLQSLPDDNANDDLSLRPTVAIGGNNYLSQRVTVKGRPPATQAGWLIVLYPEDRWSEAIRQAAYPALAAGGAAALAVVLVTTLLAHRFVRPIRQLCDQAELIAGGDFRPLNLARRNDELRDLAASINRMSERLGQYETQVRRHEQLRTLDRLGAALAHQLRNAATGGRMAIELHQRECPGGAAAESLKVALQQLRLMESYLQRFLSPGRDQPMLKDEVNFSVIVADALSLVQPACNHAGIEMEFQQCADPLIIHGDAEALGQLVMNLVINAIEATSLYKGSKRISVALERSNGAAAVLHVCNTGPKMPPKVAEHLFEPFVTGKPEGTGLGLYVARQVVRSHGGSISWQREGETTCFTVTLPLISSPQSLNPNL